MLRALKLKKILRENSKSLPNGRPAVRPWGEKKFYPCPRCWSCAPGVGEIHKDGDDMKTALGAKVRWKDLRGGAVYAQTNA